MCISCPSHGLDFAAEVTHRFGMELEAFSRSLRAFVRRMPFQPFTVELTSGSRFQVLHPEALAFNGGLGVYISPDGTPSLFDHESVSQLIGTADSQRDAAGCGGVGAAIRTRVARFMALQAFRVVRARPGPLSKAASAASDSSPRCQISGFQP
jgi:hypothetical protein